MLDEEALRARFELIEIDGEGILLNRESGTVYRLNHSAYEIWAARVAGQPLATIAGQLERRFGLDRERAERDVMSALEAVPEVPQQRHVDPFRWGVTPRGYGLFRDESLICEVDSLGASLRLPDGFAPTDGEARACLKAVAPKLLTLRGAFVLHASAVERDGSLLVFSGRSGAGKTTTARAFAQAGARLVSEDLLVLVPSPAGPRAVVDGEAVIRAWISTHAAQLFQRPQETVACGDLDRCVEGRRLPITKILLVDADRRAGDRIGLEELSRADALVALMESIYFASSDAGSWHARLLPLRDLVKAVATFRVTMPQGLPALDAAARTFRQNEMTAS